MSSKATPHAEHKLRRRTREARATHSPAESLSHLAQANTTATDLRRRLTYLMAFRVLLITLVMGATTLLYWLSDADLTKPSSLILYGVIAITYLLTIFYAWLLEHSSGHQTLALWQIAGDLVIASVIVHVTGGAQSAYTFFYPLAVIASAVVRYQRGAILFTGAAAILFLGVSYLGWRGFIPTPGGAVAPPAELETLAFGRALGLNLAAILGVGTMAVQLAAQLQKSSKDLEIHRSVAADLLTLHQDIIRCLTSGLVTVDTRGLILSMNESACEMLEITPNKAIGSPLERVSKSLAKALIQPTSTADARREEVQHQGGHGAIALGLSISPLVDHTGERVGQIINFQDLTEVRHLEDKIKRAERLSAIGTMAAGIAHEIRNPLASISGSIELLGGSPAQDDDATALMNIVTREIDRLNSLITVLLDYANPRPPSIMSVDLCEVIADTLRVFAQNANFVDVCVEFENTNHTGRSKLDPIALRADPEKIRQVIWNLLHNGAEAARQGGKHVWVSARVKGKTVMLCFRDNGPGIKRDNLSKVFDPFFTTKSKGSGLGLAVVQSTILDHHGKIWVESEEGFGASFHVQLPYAQTHDE